MPPGLPAKRFQSEIVSETISALSGGWLHPGGEKLTRRALEAAAFCPGARILDLGCGPGASLELMTGLGFTALGLDRSRARARKAFARAPAVLADMAALPFADAAFDGILCECVLSLAADKQKVLTGCARLLRPGGRLALSDLALAQSRESEAGPGPPPGVCALGAVSAGELRVLLEAAGLTLILAEDHSRALRELAAQLAWRGHSLAALSGLCHTESGPGTARAAGARLGYLLAIAEKRE